jgi:hypothetical protein
MVRMRNLAIALSVGFLGVASAGCSSTPAGGSGQIQLTWELRQGSASGPNVNCAAGETVEVTVGGVTDVFDCGSLGGVTNLHPVGSYDVVFDLVLANQVESTVTMPGVPIVNRSVTDVGHIIFVLANTAPGSMSFTWEIRVGSAGGANGTCAAGEMFVIDAGAGGTFQADCPGGASTGTVSVPSVPAGVFNVTINLQMGATVESTTTMNGVTIASGANTDLGHIIFVVAAKHR